MPKVNLTDRFCATVTARSITDFFDIKTKGLNLRVAPSGSKSWAVMFTSPETEKRARMMLGTYPATSLATARTLAIEAHSKVEAGDDPRAMAGSYNQYMTVAMLVENYIAKHARTIKSGKALAQRLRSDVLPIIGNVKLAQLHRRDVQRVLDQINDRGSPQSERKVFGDIRSMIRWAVSRGDLEHDMMAGMKAPGVSPPRERYLTEDEIAALWEAWPTLLPRRVALALKLALVTGQRIGEITGMTEDELDGRKSIWTIPAERAKNGQQHVVPLTPMALSLVNEARSTAINGRLFPGLNSVKIGQQVIRYRDRLPVSDWAAHDLRRSVCTHMAKMGVPTLHIGAVANHRQVTKAGVTLTHYVQHDYAKEKREALDLWADRLAAIVRGGAGETFTHAWPRRGLTPIAT
jgi:integrase